MVKKQFSFFLMILFVVTSLSILEADNDLTILNGFYNGDPWGFIGKKFYDDTKAGVGGLKKGLLKVGLAAVCGGCSGVGGLLVGKGIGNVSGYATQEVYNWAFDENKTGIKDAFGRVGFVSGGLIGLLGGSAVAYAALDSYISRKTDESALNNFIKNWLDNSKNTPSALRVVFEGLHEKYVTSGWESIRKYTPEIVRDVRKKLAGNDRRYEALYKVDTDYFECKHFVTFVNIDVAKLFEVFGNFIGAMVRAMKK
mgnify:CR=1 FL=1|jgi:hypothetical protein